MSEPSPGGHSTGLNLRPQRPRGADDLLPSQVVTHFLVLVLAGLIGAVAGLRALTAPAVVAWAAMLHWINLDGTWVQWLGHPITVAILTVLALGELITDQLPKTPSRTVPMQFIARLITGGYHELLIWDATTGTLQTRVGNMPQRTFALAFNPAGTLLAVAGGRPAVGVLAEDGSFTLSTYKEGDGLALVSVEVGRPMRPSSSSAPAGAEGSTPACATIWASWIPYTPTWNRCFRRCRPLWPMTLLSKC